MAIVALLLEHFGDSGLTQDDLLTRLTWLRDVVAPRMERFLGYYRNPTADLASALSTGAGTATSFLTRPFRQFQELGLPARITGFRRAADGACVPVGALDVQRKEVVIENDIGWRIDTLVDFAAARMPGITSTARDPALRARLSAVINDILETVCGGTGNGAVTLLQELVLQGCICGAAWVQMRPSAELLTRLAAPGAQVPELEVSRWLRLEVMDARHVLGVGIYAAILRDDPGTRLPAPRPVTAGLGLGLLDRVRAWLGNSSPASAGAGAGAENFSFDLIGAHWWQRYDKGVLAEEGANPLGFVPMVRYENAADPMAGTRFGPAGSGVVDVGLGDVEPLIGLQDELNTRLSDRAFRVTMSSFRMYLGKGIEDFVTRPIGPGQMWGTDNPAATIETFGGDAATPSEESHINEVREALDKISGVSPVAAGLIRGKLGNLTSAVALRLTLIALLARTERKRAVLTQVISAVVRMALAALDKAGLLRTAAEDRGVDVNWPTALPESDMDRLAEAQAKLSLGVPREVILKELGYGELTMGPPAAKPASDEITASTTPAPAATPSADDAGRAPSAVAA